VVASWLLELTAGALAANPTWKAWAGRVSDSARAAGRSRRRSTKGGDARLVGGAVRTGSAARGEALYRRKLLSAMRQAFVLRGVPPPVE